MFHLKKNNESVGPASVTTPLNKYRSIFTSHQVWIKMRKIVKELEQRVEHQGKLNSIRTVSPKNYSVTSAISRCVALFHVCLACGWQVAGSDKTWGFHQYFLDLQQRPGTNEPQLSGCCRGSKNSAASRDSKHKHSSLP